MFPEGGVWQEQQLGGRFGARAEAVGKLKWGVGKMIAHSPKTPVVIPMFIAGSETIFPQDPDTKKLLNAYPKLYGHNVDIRFGEEIHFEDLIALHEEKYGPVRKFHAQVLDECDHHHNSNNNNNNINNNSNNNNKNSNSDTDINEEFTSSSSSSTTLTTTPAAAATTATTTTGSNDDRGRFHAVWDSQPHELELYHQITRRIEQHLHSLNLESNADRLE